MEIKIVQPTVCGGDPKVLHPEVLSHIIETSNKLAPLSIKVKNGTVTILEYRLDQQGSLVVALALDGIALEEFDMDVNVKVVCTIQIK